MNSFVVVFPACKKDLHLLMLMLDWMAELGQQPTHRCILSLSKFILPHEVAALEAAVSKVFIHWKTHMMDDALGKFPWPIPHNNHFQKTARTLKRDLEGQPEQFWFWVEADCVPMHKDWLARFDAEHAVGQRQGKMFTGALVCPPAPTSTPDHMTGNAIYPRDLSRYAPAALLVGKTAWDVGAAEEIIPQAYFTNILQHVYESPKFATIREANLTVRTTTLLFHQSKDGSLIARLRDQKALEIEQARIVSEDREEFLPPQEMRISEVGVRGIRHKGKRSLIGAKAAEKIWTSWHYGLNGGHPQTYGQIAKLNDISVKTAQRVVKYPEKYGFKPTRDPYEQKRKDAVEKMKREREAKAAASVPAA